MADVQLERGHVRLANHLDEAITWAPFSITQMKIVRCLIRITWGWRQWTVTISHPDLAKRCGLSDSGGFRREMAKLLRAGVIREVAKGTGPIPNTYAFNKNFEEWGEYSVPERMLEALFDERLPSLDSPPPKRQGNPPEAAEIDAPPVGQDNGDDATDSENGDLPHTGQMICPTEGSISAPKSRIGETLDSPKDRKTGNALVSTDQFTQPPTTAVADEQSAEVSVEKPAVVRLACAANNGLAAHRTRPQPIPRILPYAGKTLQAAQEIESAGVPIEFAERAIEEHARTHQADDEIGTLRYFVKGVIREWNQSLAKEDMQRLPGRGTPTPIASLLDRRAQADKHQRDGEALHDRYNAERRTAAEAWAKEPANATALRLITIKAQLEIGDVPGSMRETMLAGVVRLACAERAGFPDLESWKSQKTLPETAVGPEREPNPRVTVSASRNSLG